MTSLRIEQIVDKHCIPLSTLDLNTQGTQEEDIEFHILSHLGDGVILKNRAQNRGVLALNLVARAHIGIVAKRHIPRLVLLHCKRKTNNAVAEHIKTCGFEVEGEM